MTKINQYKRKCDYCEKIVDITECLTIIKGKKHSCKKCATDRLKILEKNKHWIRIKI